MAHCRQLCLRDRGAVMTPFGAGVISPRVISESRKQLHEVEICQFRAKSRKMGYDSESTSKASTSQIPCVTDKELTKRGDAQST